MAEGRDNLVPKASPDATKNGLQQELFGPQRQREGGTSTTPPSNRLVDAAYFALNERGPQVPSGPDFTDATQSDADAAESWNNLITKDLTSVDFFGTLRESVIKSAKIKLEAAGGTPATTGDSVPRLRMNLRHLRIKEGKARANDYLSNEMRVFDRAFLAVGERQTQKPTPWNNESLAMTEVQRQARFVKEQNAAAAGGAVFDKVIDTTPREEKSVLHTVVCENLREHFPIVWDRKNKTWAKDWTDANPWSDAEKEKLANKLQLTGDKANNFQEVDRLHNRFLVAATFAETTEKGRPYLVRTNRATLSQYVVDHLGDELHVTKGKAWLPADRQAFAKKYEITELEVDQMRKRVTDMKNKKIS